ncbi:MAG: MFS transporter [Candidatus Bathyarchaeia archaeon]
MSKGGFPYRVVATVWFGWLSIMLPRMIITPLIPTIKEDYGLTNAQAGLLMTGYLYPYSSMQIPAGTLCDRFGTKRLIILALKGSSSMALMIWLTRGFPEMLTFRVLAGVLAGMWYAPSTTLLTLTVKEEDRGKALGMVFTGASLSDVIIYALVGLIGVERFDWHYYFLFCSLPGLLCALLVGTTTREPSLPSPVKEGVSGGRESVVEVLKERPVLSNIVFTIVIFLLTWSLRTFLPTYFVEHRLLSDSEASLLMIVYASTMILGGPLAGYLVDRLGYRLPALVSLAVLCIVILALPSVPMGLPTAAILILWGLAGGWSLTAFNVLLIETVPPRVRGTFLGIYNSASFMGAATGPYLLGYVADVAGFGSFFMAALVLCVLATLIAATIKID